MNIRHDLLFMKLDEILRPFEELSAMTYDPEFTHERATFYARVQAQKNSSIFSHLTEGHNIEAVNYIQEKVATFETKEPEFPTDSSEILDLMKLYYKDIPPAFMSPGPLQSFPRAYFPKVKRLVMLQLLAVNRAKRNGFNIIHVRTRIQEHYWPGP
jgi:hypothetical protein